MAHTTKYETRDGKTYRAEDAPPAPSGGTKPSAAPESDTAAETTHTPARPAKQGA
jgi:hypothetical protein